VDGKKFFTGYVGLESLRRLMFKSYKV